MPPAPATVHAPRPSGRSGRTDAIATRVQEELVARHSATIERLRPALRALAEELAEERRRSATLRRELDRVRDDLAAALAQRSGVGDAPR